jgi:F-type H+-transporting ATPase subunit gamma
MSDGLEGLRRQLSAAGELKSVVRAMKALAASSLGQYEKAVLSLAEYDRTVQLALKAGLTSPRARALLGRQSSGAKQLRVVAFGSDQGLVGQFNEIIAEKIELEIKPEKRPVIIAVGERLTGSLTERGFQEVRGFGLPQSVDTIAGFIGQLLEDLLKSTSDLANLDLRLYHHRPEPGARYVAVAEKLFPLDQDWVRSIDALHWPTNQHPECIGSESSSFEALLREHLFIALFRACAESLASENASRLVAMQRAEKNIDELSETLTRRFHQLRQSSIDEELFDVVAGFESLAKRRPKPFARISPLP